MAYHAAFEVDFYYQTAVEFSHSLGRKQAFHIYENNSYHPKSNSSAQVTSAEPTPLYHSLDCSPSYSPKTLPSLRQVQRLNYFKFAKICAHEERQCISEPLSVLPMQEKLFWEAFSNEDRNTVITQIKDIVSKHSAYIINFTMFSDLALSLSLGVEENKILDLHCSLCEILTVSDLTFENSHKKVETEWLILLNVSFGKGKGSLKNEVPEVPG